MTEGEKVPPILNPRVQTIPEVRPNVVMFYFTATTAKNFCHI